MKRDSVVRKHPLLYCLAGLLCVLSALTPSRADTTPPFDTEIAGMTLMKLTSGPEALQAINKLHGTAIPMKKGFIAHYLGTQGKATLWVSEAPSVEAGTEQIDVMIDKMKGNERSPFRNYGQSVVNKTPVIRFHGMGQVHVVFQIDAWVYWISAHEQDMDSFLSHLCKPRSANLK